MIPFLLVVLFASLANAKVGNFIVGGQDASILEQCIYVSLEYLGNHACGGTIITRYHVITAAQCQFPIHALKVRAGTIRRGHGGSLHNVAAFIRHENYRIMWTGIPVNDIAIVKIEEPFVLDPVRFAMPQFEGWQTLSPNDKGFIIGFGITNNGALAKLLQLAQVSVVSEDTCRLIYLSSGGLPEGQFCAGNMDNSGQDICTGDAGGPIVVNSKLAGIISWSTGCAKKFFPSVYTEIAYYREWIDAHTK